MHAVNLISRCTFSCNSSFFLQPQSFKSSNGETQPIKRLEEQIMFISKQSDFSPPFYLKNQEEQLPLIFTRISGHPGKWKYFFFDILVGHEQES